VAGAGLGSARTTWLACASAGAKACGCGMWAATRGGGGKPLLLARVYVTQCVRARACGLALAARVRVPRRVRLSALRRC
jgi:hypothetical protein